MSDDVTKLPPALGDPPNDSTYERLIRNGIGKHLLYYTKVCKVN